MRDRRRTSVFRRSISVLVLCIVSLGAACKEVGTEGFVKAAGIDVGDRESHVSEVAGLPTRKGEPSPDCAAKGGKYALVYEVGLKWFGGYEASSWVVLCIDELHTVVSNHMIQI